MVWLLVALKVIGIILLCVLGIVLILACLVLFVPIKYKYKFKYIDENMDTNCHYIDISWLMQIIKCKIEISLSGVDFKTRLFGIRTKWLDKIISRESDSYNEEEFGEDLESQDEEDEASKTIDEIEEIWEDIAKAEDDLKAALGQEKEITKSRGHTEKESDKNRIIAWIKSKLKVLNPKVWLKILVDKLIAFGKFIDKLKNSVIETTKIIIKRYNLIAEFLDKKSTMSGIEKAKTYIEKTCKHIFPRKKKIVLHIGFDDPSLTGKALGVLGLIYAKMGKFLEVYPNFSEKELKASVLFKGRIRGISILIIGLRVIRDKAIKRLLRNIKMVKEEW